MKIILPLIFIIIYTLTYKVSKYFKLFDIPNSRKNHHAPVVFTGGLATAINFYLLTFFFNYQIQILIIFYISFFIMLTGLIDDIYNLKATTKLLFQTTIIILLIFITDLKIDNLGYYFHTSLNLGSLSMIFTVACVLTLINGLNYFDGIHGLASLTFITIILNIILLNLLDNNSFDIELIWIIIPILCFLLFNLRILKFPRLFLGDNGSNFLGFILAFLAIYYVQDNSNSLNHYNVIWLFSLIVFEFLATTLTRIIQKRGIFQPGKDHIHYLLFDKLKSKIYTIIFLLFLNQLLFIFGYYSSSKIENYNLPIFVLAFFIYFLIRYKLLISQNK